MAWGVLALANPAPLAVAPLFWLWVCFRHRRQGMLNPGHALCSGLLALACVAPWLVRNHRTFGEFAFIRGNLGEELHLGNAPGGLGTWMGWRHPVQNAQEFEQYRAMGETAYIAQHQREALGFIAGNPGLFLANTARRVYWFWCGTTRGEAGDPLEFLRNFAYIAASLLSLAGLGLMIQKRTAEGVLLAGLLLLFPLIYYVTFVFSRYRQMIEPEMMLLMVYALSSSSGPGGWRLRGRSEGT